MYVNARVHVYVLEHSYLLQYHGIGATSGACGSTTNGSPCRTVTVGRVLCFSSPFVRSRHANSRHCAVVSVSNKSDDSAAPY